MAVDNVYCRDCQQYEETAVMRQPQSTVRRWNTYITDELLCELYPATVRMVQDAVERIHGERPGWKFTREVMRRKGFLLDRNEAISVGRRYTNAKWK